MGSVGKRISRVDARGIVSGKNEYGADCWEPGMLCGRVLRSPLAHARIRRLDLSRALALPGVRAVLCAKEAPRLFARNEVTFHGQKIAALAADTWEQAEEALRLIEVEYQPLPSVADVRAALRPGAPKARMTAECRSLKDREGRSLQNVARSEIRERGDVGAAFREAEVTLDLEFSSAVVHQGYLEPHSATARPDADGTFTVWSGAQGLFGVRQDVARALGVPFHRVRVVGMCVGGAFGGKNYSYLEPIAAVLARRTGKTVQVRDTREDVLVDSHPGPACYTRIRGACRGDGRLWGIDAEVYWDGGGAGSDGPSSNLVDLYAVPNSRILSCGVYTNKLTPGFYRAPGAPQMAFVQESVMDELACLLGVDPVEFRLRNLPEGGSAGRVLRAVSEAYGWNRRRSAVAAKRADGAWRRGIGLAMGDWANWVGTSTSGVLLNDDGSLSVVTGSVDITGAHTALLQIAADEMEVQPERVHIRLADTDAVPYHDPSGGSRTVYAGGLAVRDAARELKRRMVETAARELEIAVDRLVYRQGSVVDRDGKDHRLSLAELGALTPHSGPLAGTATVANRPTPSAYTICIVELAVDVGTGKVRLDRVFSALEAGRAINPTLVEGQIQGAVLQGIAMALWEEYVFGPDGRVLNPNLLDYRTGTSMDVPPIETLILEYGNSEGPFDAKGVGEPPIIPPAAAVANAVRDALGRRLTHLPLTPERILLGKE